VLTGETGAGKSFIMRALNFLAGDSLSPDMVRPGKEKAVVEAFFVLDGQDLLLRRELVAGTGRSRIYLNDRLCSQDTLKDMRPSLVLHASQHGQQRLLQPSFQARILDDFMQRPDLLEKRNSLVRALADIQDRKVKLDQALADLAGKRDLLEYQQQEIEKVGPQPDEEEALENRRAAFRNQAALSGHVAAALSALHGGEEGPGLLRQFAVLERALTAMSGILDEFAGAPESLSEMRLALQDLDARLRRNESRKQSDLDIEDIESRLYALAQLKRKLKRPLGAIISLRQEIADNLDFLDSRHLEQKKLLAEEKETGDALAAILDVLNPARETAAAAFSSAIRDELQKLGFSEHIQVFFTFSPQPLIPEREDCRDLRCRLLWQPNPGQPPQPLDKIASGGELSRFLLAVISLMSRAGSENPTLVFDEVDAGVGGLTLNRLAESLTALALTRQMLLITHWPQLAGKARRHFTVCKEVLNGMTYTRCQLLEGEAVRQELLRMAGRE
jgi:DNA repair protein RecN (Recombination protein N)